MKGSIVTSTPSSSSHVAAPLDISASSTNPMSLSSFRDMVDGDIDVAMKTEPSSPDISVASSLARRSDRSSDHTIDGHPSNNNNNNNNNLNEFDDDSVKSENGMQSAPNGVISDGSH